jgi:hypothetical protein
MRWATSATEMGVAVGIVVGVDGILVGEGGAGVEFANGGRGVAVRGSAVNVGAWVAVGIGVAGSTVPALEQATTARTQTMPNAHRTPTIFQPSPKPADESLTSRTHGVKRGGRGTTDSGQLLVPSGVRGSYPAFGSFATFFC